jgi:hypothetical protein
LAENSVYNKITQYEEFQTAAIFSVPVKKKTPKNLKKTP